MNVSDSDEITVTFCPVMAVFYLALQSLSCCFYSKLKIFHFPESLMLLKLIVCRVRPLGRPAN